MPCFIPCSASLPSLFPIPLPTHYKFRPKGTVLGSRYMNPRANASAIPLDISFPAHQERGETITLNKWRSVVCYFKPLASQKVKTGNIVVSVSNRPSCPPQMSRRLPPFILMFLGIRRRKTNAAETQISCNSGILLRWFRRTSQRFRRGSALTFLIET